MRKSPRMAALTLSLSLIALSLMLVAATPAPAAKKDSITIGIAYLPRSLDAQGFDDQVTNALMSNVYEPLVRVTPDQKLIPGAAESWEISPDGKEYTFHLYKNATFHDGSPVTAEDAQFTIERCVASKVVGTYFNYVDKAEALDPHTLKVTLKHPYAPFPHILRAFGGIVSKKYVETNPAPFVHEAMGSGPYKFVEYKQGDQFALTAHPGYHLGQAPIKNLTYKQITNSSSSAMALEAGELDMLVNVAPEDLQRIKADPNLKVDEIASVMSSIFQFNLKTKPFEDVRVRRAVAHAINKQDVIIGATDGLATEAVTLIPEGVIGYDPDIKSPEYDLEKAKKLLAEAGYPKGFTFTIMVNEPRRSHTEVIQANLREAGIIANIELMESAAFYEAITKGSFAAFVGGWGYLCLDPDVVVYDLYCSKCVESGNGGSYSNPEVDRLLEEARVAVEPAERQELYAKINRITMEEVPVIPLLWNASNIAYNKDIQGVIPICNEQYLISRFSWKD